MRSRRVLWLLLLPLLPLLALPFFAVPQAEDFCWGLQGRAYGLLGGIAERYENWGGRLPAHGLMILPTTLADALGVPLTWTVRGLLLLALAGLLATVAWLAARLAERQPGIDRVGLALLLLTLLIAGARAPRDLLAWLPSVVTYVPAGLGSLAVYLLLLAPPTPLRRAAMLAAAAFAGLSVEFGPLLTLLAAAAALAQRPERWRLVLAVGAVALAALALLAAAPGNAVRGDIYQQDGDLWRSLWRGPTAILEVYGQNFGNPAVLGSLLLIGWLAARAAQATPAAPEPAASPWWPLLLAALGGSAAMTLGVWAMGGSLPARAHNALLLFALPLLVLALILAVRRSDGLRRLAASRPTAVVGTLLVLLGPLPWHAYAELGDAVAFGRAGAARLEALAAAAPGTAAEVAALPAYPLLLTQEELSPDPAYWANRCVATYYDLASVRLVGDGPDYLAGTQPYWFAWRW